MNNLDAFMAEFAAQTTRLNRVMFAWNQNPDILFEVKPFDGAISLGYIGNCMLDNRGQGQGSLALDWFCSLADKHEVTVTLNVQTIFRRGERHLDKRQLRNWYKRRGFTGLRGSRAMKRTPVTN